MRTKKILLGLGMLSLAGLIFSVFAQSIENIQLVPNLDISRFAPYRLHVTTTGEILSGEFLMTTINGDSGYCTDYYASGNCASPGGITSFTGAFTYSGDIDKRVSANIYPDNIYPEIFFADGPTTWNNEPEEMLMSRNSYELMYFNNPFSMQSGMSFFIELNIRPRNTANSENLLVYLVEKSKDISFFGSERRNDTGVQLVGSFSRTAIAHHTHTANSSHYLVPLSTNGDGTIGNKNIDISTNFWIVIVADTGLPSKGRYLRYQTGALCQNTSGRYEGDLNTRSTTRQSGCPDAHIHIARRGTNADSLQAEISIYATGDTTITGEWSGSFAPLPNLAPNATSFITPTSGSYTGDTGIYSGDIYISRYPATDPNGDSVSYTIYLTDLSGNTLETLTGGISMTGFTRDSTITGSNYTGDGLYSLKGEACDNEPLCSEFSLAEPFEIDNVEDPDTFPPTFNITSGQYFSGDVHVEVTDENYSGTIVTYSGFDTLYTVTGFTLTGEGYYFLTAYDTTGNNSSIGFFIDLTSPTFTGVISGTTYYTGVSIDFFDNNDGVTATLSGGEYTGGTYTSGTLITATGEYIFIVTDSAGNSTGATFTITDPDTTPPTATIEYSPAGPSRTSGDVIAILTGFSEPVININQTGYTFTDTGTFLFTFEDLAGNTGETLATVNRIDKITPTFAGVTSGAYYSGDIHIIFEDDNLSGATLNGNPYNSGDTISAEGTYNFEVTDLAGNSTGATFTIDTTAPTFGGITSGAYYTGTVTITFDDFATLNGTAITSGYTTGADGNYELIVYDLAGNSTGATFTIDNTLPQVSNIISGQRFSGNITPTIVETNYSGATLNGSLYMSGTAITTDGTYELIIYDRAGNSFAVSFGIDKTAPTLTGTTTFSSNNTTNSGYAKTNDIITVLFTSHEALTGTPTMTISGGSLSTGTVTHIGGNNYSGTYIMKSGDTEGAIGFNITMTDLVGNTGTIFTGSTIIFDRTAPAGITITAPTTGTYLKGDPDVYVITWNIGTETNYGATPLLLEYSVTNFVSTTNIITGTANDGSHTFMFPNTLNTFAKIRIIATDLAGNVSYFTGNQFSIDNTPPTDITITYPGLYLKGNSGYIINRSGGIDANPETIILAYTTNGTTFTTICTRTNNEQSCTRNTPNINSSTVQLRTIATDKVGMNKQRTTPTFIVDSISPTAIVFADNNSNRRNTNATATGTSTDALAGLRTTGMVYRIDTAFTGTCDGGTTTPPTFTTEGYHTGYACIMDNAGNIRTGQQSYKIDKTAPILIIGSGILTNTATIINITGTDALAGISGYLRSQISGPGIATFTTATSEDPSVSANTDGTYVLQVVVRDNANNITTGTTNFTRDTTAPILSGATSVLNTTSQTPNYSFTGNEGGTISYSGGCTSATTTAISGNNTITFSTLANGTYASCQLRVTDTAGNNSSRLTIPTFTVSYTAPSGGGGGGGGGGFFIPTCALQDLICVNGTYEKKTNVSCQGGELGNSCGTDICVDGDYSGDPNDGICYDPTKVEAQTGTSNTGKRIPFTSPYNKELTDAYSYAYGVKITTVPKIERANLTGVLIRSHLAKMMSEYAIKVLGKTPDTSRQCNFKDMGKQTEEFQRYAKMACQLGLMGLKTDGSPADIFNPEDQVNRAIFGTTLSRALFGGTHNGGQNRYERHLQALKSSAVMNIINSPFNRELRGYVMLMMMRADQKISKSSYSNFNSLRGSSVFVPTTSSTNTQTGTQFTATELDFIKNINKAYQFTEGYTIGQSNPGVKYLQYFLKAKKYYDGTINGVNNTATVAALFQFQFDNDIVSKQSDQGAGYLGPTTRDIINPLLQTLLNP